MTAVTPHQQGRLEQVCPACGLVEAAGSYCTRCVARTGPDHWRLTERSDAQRAASRATALRGVATEKTAKPGPVAGRLTPSPSQGVLGT